MPYHLGYHIQIISIQVQQQLPNEQNNPHVFQVSFETSLLPLRESDFNGLFDSVLTADAFLVLSNNESTDSATYVFVSQDHF
jgi:hypothetical protein